MSWNGLRREISQLRIDACILKHAHFNSSHAVEKRHLWLGIPIVLINILVGSIFLSDYEMFKDYLAPSLSLCAALLAGLQTYLNLNKKVALHQSVGNAYSDIARDARKLEAQIDDNVIDVEKAWDSYNQLVNYYSDTNRKAEGCFLKDSHFKHALAKTKEVENTVTAEKILNSVELVLIRGLPGSGKSTLAKTMKGYSHFEADMFFEKNGEFNFDRSKVSDAHAWCMKRTKEELDNGNSVVVSNTFTRNVEMKPYFEMGYRVRVIEANGNWMNIHGVPEEHIELMRSKWEELVLQ